METTIQQVQDQLTMKGYGQFSELTVTRLRQ